MQQLHLLKRIVNPKWTEAQQGRQFNQWIIDISRYELETSVRVEESAKNATAINNLRGAVRQHLLLSIRPTTWREVRDANIASIKDINYIKKLEERERAATTKEKRKKEK